MRLKLSYSLMAMWERGEQSAVIEALHGHWRQPNEYMKFGIQMHEEWEREVKETGMLPTVFGSGALREPQTELYKVIQLADWLWLSGIVDLKDGTTLCDYKTGRGTASSYTNSMQHGVYKVLHPEATLFRYLCWNQYTNTVTTSMVHLTDNLYTMTLDRILTIACDIRATMENMGMEEFDNVKKPLKNSEIGKV